MHIIIPLFFKASHGGLHENILATARFLTARQHKVTIVCPAGPFADSLIRYNIDVIETDYSDYGSTLEDVVKVHSAHPIDLVHTHPFASRKFSLALADRLDIPFILTFHGKYTDDLTQYIDKAAAVLAVSPGIRDFILSENSEAPEKFHAVPNVPDIEIFKPAFDKPKRLDEKLKVSLVSR